MKIQESKFYPKIIRITCVVISFVAVIGSLIWFGTSISSSQFFKYLFLVLFLIALVGMKFSAPQIPWWQFILAMAAIGVIHTVGEYVFPLIFFAEIAIDFICVFCFGNYWVKEGYLPKWSNRW